MQNCCRRRRGCLSSLMLVGTEPTLARGHRGSRNPTQHKQKLENIVNESEKIK